RGHYLRTRHQLEKAIGRVTDVPLARYAIEEILLNRAWSQTADAARDGIEMLRRLAQNAAVGDGVLAVVRHVTARLAARAREAREQAARLIPSSWTAHDVLALRLQSLHVHHVLDRVSASLASAGLDTCVVMAGGHAEVDRLAYEQLTTLHQQLRDSEPAPARAGGHVSRLAQRRRLDALLSATPWHDEDGDIRTSAATTSAQGRATPLVVGPHDIDADITALAGAKAGNLADAARVVGESAIPEWFAVTRHAFHEAVDAGARHDIEAILADAALGPDAQSSAIRELFRRLALPQRLVQAVAEAYRAMGSDVYVAVRSSALDEDTECSTRAGQFETFLFVRGAQAVTEHLALAWGGFWTARAIADRLVRHDTACPSGGIVIQRMVQSRVSGVMQTINVAGAHPREIVINAGLGLGEGIVSGRVAADHIVVAKDPPGSGALRFRYVTADKRERVVFDERLGRGTVRVDTLAHQRLRPVLEYPEVCALVETALRLEAAYGQPVDIEFGFEGPDLRVLQVRPLPSTAAVWRETMERFPLLSPGRREEARDDSP
ncbi:MAG: PEP/pyruvate-binding domain-containing protein, partial [Acidobacteria bacterium]|nr:PEP/pyruvate-binding domain-containing protein [Acidobacteriota bacterium]